MKAALHLAIFVMTVYDYMFPKKNVSAEEDEETHMGSTNKDRLLEYTPDRQFKSMQETPSNFPFDSDEDEEHKNEEEVYRMMEEPIEGYAATKEEPGLITRVWNGAGEIITRYHRRTRALEKHTSEVVRGAYDNVMESRRQANNQVQAEREVRMYLRDTNQLQSL
jgi:hypothetical protein